MDGSISRAGMHAIPGGLLVIYRKCQFYFVGEWVICFMVSSRQSIFLRMASFPQADIAKQQFTDTQKIGSVLKQCCFT